MHIRGLPKDNLPGLKAELRLYWGGDNRGGGVCDSGLRQMDPRRGLKRAGPGSHTLPPQGNKQKGQRGGGEQFPTAMAVLEWGAVTGHAIIMV